MYAYTFIFWGPIDGLQSIIMDYFRILYIHTVYMYVHTNTDTIQNKVIQLFSCAIQSEIVSHGANSPFYRLIADGTTDGCNTEQFSLTLRQGCFSQTKHPN